jgi:hypothetical protein
MYANRSCKRFNHRRSPRCSLADLVQDFINMVTILTTPLTPALSPRQRVERGLLTARSQAPAWERRGVQSSCFGKLGGERRYRIYEPLYLG